MEKSYWVTFPIQYPTKFSSDKITIQLATCSIFQTLCLTLIFSLSIPLSITIIYLYSVCLSPDVSRKIVKKMDIFVGLYRIHVLVFFYLFMNIHHYFLVYIFKYHTCLRIFLLIFFLWVRYLVVLFIFT